MSAAILPSSAISFDSTFSSFDNAVPSDDSQKFDPPSPPPLPRASVIVFGSQGSDFLNAFDAIIGLSHYHAELAAFLSLALTAVRAELQSVASRYHHVPESDEFTTTGQRKAEVELLASLPPFEPFAGLRTLVDFHRRSQQKDPTINGVLLCLLQTASVVAVCCVAHHDQDDPHAPSTASGLKRAWKALTQPCSHLLGYCTGALSAFSLREMVEHEATASSVDIWAYAKDAIRAIRICFWISLRSAHARLRLISADDSATASDPWSFLVSVKDPDLIQNVYLYLARFNDLEQQRPLDKPIPLVVSARALNQISIAGLPRQLQRFKAYLLEHLGSKCKMFSLKLFSPYHMSDLAPEADLVMRDLEHRKLVDPSNLSPSLKSLWETKNANILSEANLQEALRVLVATNLCATADWNAMVDQLVSLEGELPRSMHPEDRVVVSFCPGASLGADIAMRLSSLHDSCDSNGSVVHIDVSAALSEHLMHPYYSGLDVPFVSQSDVNGEEVVIVSMACRFPGEVCNPDQFWTCLETGRSTVTEIPKHLFDIDAYYGDGVNQTMARHMHALPENVVKSMDARLFSMSPKEIEQLDPQHRLVMLCSYEALERAGYSAEANSPSSFDGKRIAVCMAASWDDYRENASWNIGSYFITGNIRAFLPGHVSFSLNWEGPSVSVDSLECSAVSALQWSRRALLSGQCDVALAGAVNVLTQPQMFIAMDKEGILSRTGTNATFSSKLDGKTRGDGCGVLLLKRRSTALRDGDKILATLPAARTTYHGSAHESEEASTNQSRFLARVMSEASVRASDLIHIEASGFHTQQAEAAEFESFSRLLPQSQGDRSSQVRDRISVASSRPNIGAGEAVSAMASVIKAVLMFQQGSVPRQISISDPSELQPSITAICAGSSLFVPTQARRLPSDRDHEGRHVILVNSLASTNCHGVVLVGAPTTDDVAPLQIRSKALDATFTRTEGTWVFLLSAKTRESAEMLRKALIDYLRRDVNLADLSYTLTCRRTHHPFRLSVVASDKDELIRSLRTAEFIEAKALADLPAFGLVLRHPERSACQNMEGSLDLIVGLRDRFEELTSVMGYSEIPADTERKLNLKQVCLALLLDDCGVHPLSFHGSYDLMQLLQRSFPAAKESDLSKRFTWIHIGSLISISTTEAAEQAKPAGSVADGQNQQRSLLSTLGSLHQKGHCIRWIEYFRPLLAKLNFIETLPTYLFNLQQHWMEYHDRDLLPRSASKEGQGGQRIRHISDGVLYSPSSQVEAWVSPSQPLLSEQTAADDRLRTYSSSLFDEAAAALLSEASPGALIAELVVEAIKEACESIEGTVEAYEHRPVRLYELFLAEVVKQWPATGKVKLSVKSVQQTGNRSEGTVQISFDATTSPVGECRYEWITQTNMHQRWWKLQKLLAEKISTIKDKGELFSPKLIYKTLGVDPTTTTMSIHSAYLDCQSSEAVVCNTIRTHTSAVGQIALPQLLSSLEEIARWFVGDKPSSADGKLTFIGVDELLICADWLDSLTRPAGASVSYTAYISQSHTDGSLRASTDGLELDILILDGMHKVVGELSRLRLAKCNSTAKKTTSKCASESTLALSSGLKTVSGSFPVQEPVEQHKEPRSTSAKPVAGRQSSRAMGLHAKVLDVLASELGVAVEEMKPTVKFADLGLDSLMSLVCISTLETMNLGLDIPQSLFMECDSPAELLQFIREQVSDGTDVGQLGPDESTNATEQVQGSDAVVQLSPSANAAETQLTATTGQGSSAVEEAMKAIRCTVETELGVDLGSIDEDANLADLGMDSLMSLLVLGNLSGTLPIELPSSLFMDCSSLGEIRSFMTSQLGAARDCARSDTVDQRDSNSQIAFFLPPVKKPILIREGSSSGMDPPLFLLPEGAGMATVYQQFPGIDRAIYSINSPFLADTSAWTGGIAQIARYYLESIKLIQPVGPWLVGGWSFGGMAAFEIARLLADCGGDKDRVAGLFILDSPSPEYPPLPMSILDWINSAPEVRDMAPPTMSAKLIAHFRATVDSLVGWEPTTMRAADEASKPLPKTWYIVAEQALPGKMEDVKELNETVRWLFRSKRAEKSGADGWQHLIPHHLTVIGVAEANHFTMVRRPNVGQVAHILQNACRNALLN